MVTHVSGIPEYPNDWAKLVAGVTRRPDWNQTKLAEAAGINRNTVRRWIKGESVNVSAQSIKLVADAAGIDYDEAAAAALGARAVDIKKDVDAVRIIEESDLPADIKLDWISYIRSRQLESEDTLRREVEMMLRTRTATPTRGRRKAS